ncbi:MAG: tetratricopeptide repeat protein [Candidatus Omnitrophica bacterium]|nr:tetratricopeptide repeat protein [Candidatus Omnitrophota bacterium]MDD5080430.1 tetratricopeptide repeat protein [Candidatus Omnitrophota bacterium]MDD5441030.1 tetratricopeptide repeat protein [Candidatus Omnitrophota bacterium]
MKVKSIIDKFFTYIYRKKYFAICICFFFVCSLSLYAGTRDKNAIFYAKYLKGIKLCLDGDYRRAIDSFNDLAKSDPNSYYVRLQLASVYIMLGDTENAILQLKKAKKIDPERLEAYWELVYIYAYTQRNADFQKEYTSFLEKSREKYPSNKDILSELGLLYYDSGKYHEALKVFSEILENDPDNIDAIFWTGIVNLDVGNEDKAVDVWEKALLKFPDAPNILNGLGYTYIERGKDLDRAKKMIDKALEGEPDNAAYIDSLGWFYYQKKDYPNAEIYLNKAIELQRDPVIYEHLGDLYLKLGDQQKAKQFYQQGFSFFPESEALKLKIEKYGFEN